MITCSRMPKRTARPRSAASARIHVDLLGDLRGRLAPGQVDVGVLGRDLARRPARSRRSRSAAPGRAAGRGTRPRPGCARRRRSTVSPAPQRPHDVQELAGPRGSGRPCPGSRRRRAARRASPPVTTLSSSRPLRDAAGRSRPSARRGSARRARGGRRRGTSAARCASASIAVVSQASSHQAPVGVSAPTKPSCSAAAGDLGQVGRAMPAGRRPAEPARTPWPPPTSCRLSPLVGRNQCAVRGPGDTANLLQRSCGEAPGPTGTGKGNGKDGASARTHARPEPAEVDMPTLREQNPVHGHQPSRRAEFGQPNVMREFGRAAHADPSFEHLALPVSSFSGHRKCPSKCRPPSPPGRIRAEM